MKEFLKSAFIPVALYGGMFLLAYIIARVDLGGLSLPEAVFANCIIILIAFSLWHNVINRDRQ